MDFHPRSTQSPSELFELLDRLQSSRLNDQRCELPSVLSPMLSNKQSDSRQQASKQMLQRILKHPPPYPTVALSNQSAYWVEPNQDKGDGGGGGGVKQPLVTCGPTHEEDSAKMYRLHFCGYEHYNFCASLTDQTPDPSSGLQPQPQPLVMSIKICSNDENNNGLMDEEDSHRHVRVILRSSDKTVHQVMRWADVMSDSSGKGYDALSKGNCVKRQQCAVLPTYAVSILR